jgi:hypothetical protein
VDAGFQKNSFQTGPPRDQYSLFIAYASPTQRVGVLKYKTSKTDPELQAYPCGQDVVVEFFSDKSGTLHLNATGIGANGTSLRERILQKTVPEDGWAPSGGNSVDGAELKRMVSVAYPKTGPIAGAWYFGHARASHTPLVRWYDVVIGANGKPSHKWSMSDTYGCQNVPKSVLFTVNFSSYDDETAAIDLAPSPLSAISQRRPATHGAPPGCG